MELPRRRDSVVTTYEGSVVDGGHGRDGCGAPLSQEPPRLPERPLPAAPARSGASSSSSASTVRGGAGGGGGASQRPSRQSGASASSLGGHSAWLPETENGAGELSLLSFAPFGGGGGGGAGGADGARGRGDSGDDNDEQLPVDALLDTSLDALSRQGSWRSGRSGAGAASASPETPTLSPAAAGRAPLATCANCGLRFRGASGAGPPPAASFCGKDCASQSAYERELKKASAHPSLDRALSVAARQRQLLRGAR